LNENDGGINTDEWDAAEPDTPHPGENRTRRRCNRNAVKS
jgi:hypothetical protein